MTRRGLIIFIFFSQALAAGGIFTRIPDIQLGLNLDEALLGLALTTAALGGLLCNLVSGRIVGRVGTRPLVAWGVPAIAIFAALVAIAPNLPLLFAALLLNGIAFSLTNIAMNVEADRVETATGTRVMNRCHGLWSAGFLLASLVGVAARALPVSATAHLAAVVPLALVVPLVVLTRMEPCPPAPGDATRRPGIALPSRRTWLLMLFGISAGIAQSGTQNWSVIFMRDTFAAPDWVDTLTLPAFLGAMALSRVFADGWTTRFGPVRVAVALTLVALGGAVAVVTSVSLWMALAGFTAMGAGTAVLLITGLVMLAAPALMGWIAESWGLRAAYAMLVPPMLVTLALVGVIAPRPQAVAA